jgi:hypothetical protein
MQHAESFTFQVGRLLPALLLCLFLLTAMSATAGVVVGSPADPVTGNCYPFGCAYGGEYQQVYESTQFSGLITITDLEFYNTQLNAGATLMNAGNWAISLSTAAAGWNSLSSTYSNNIGGDNTLVFNGDLAQAWAFGNTLKIVFTTPFTYNPLNGNLLLDVVASGTTAPGGDIFFDTNGYNGGGFNGNTFLGRVYCSGCGGGTGNVNNGYGLVTGFDAGSSGVPEPATEALFGLGIAVFGLVARRRLSR